MQKSRYFY